MSTADPQPDDPATLPPLNDPIEDDPHEGIERDPDLASGQIRDTPLPPPDA